MSFPRNAAAGNLILVGFDFATNATFSSIADSQGNTFAEVGNQLTSPGGARSRVYYAKNIKGGADTVTINLSGTSGWIEVYLTEYSGLDPTNPIDAQAGASGNAGGVSSGTATTTDAGDIIYSYCVGDSTCTVGFGFAARSTLNNNLIEDMTAGNPGTYAATGTANNGWTMQMVALRPASSTDTTPPSVPNNLFGTSTFSTQVNLSWSPSTDNVGVAGYQILRNGTQVATSTGTSYIDTGLAASTTYAYRIIAFDAAGNRSAPSNSLAVTTVSEPYGPVYPLRVSSNGQYLVDQSNEPFFWVGDQPYTLITELSDPEVETYLSDRASRGFNVIWVGAADSTFQTKPPYNFYGHAPFDGVDFTNEDPEYWAHADHVIQRALAYGITVLFSPGFVGPNSSGGYLTSYENSSDAVMTAYGAWLGARYRDCPNIIWALGGDADPANPDGKGTVVYDKLSALAKGIKSVDTVHLMTFEATRYTNGSAAPNGGYSSLDVLSGPPSWLNLNWVYLNPAYIPSAVETNYSRSPWLPPFMGEDWCEGEHSMTELQVRQEGYGAILGGAHLGRTFCNNAIWSFGSPYDTMGQTWQSQLGAAGSVGQSILGRLFKSREHWLLIPDIHNNILTAGYQSGSTLAVAASTMDGQSIIAYIPAGQTVIIDLAKISGSSARAWWFNPQTGASTLIGTFPAAGSKSFTPMNQNDWVLVVDDASATLPPPGGGTLLPTPDTTPPSVPANLTDRVISSSQINLSWTASTDNVAVAGYRVFRNGSQVATTATTSYMDTGLKPSTTYSYAVDAFDAAGNVSALSAPVDPTTSLGVPSITSALTAIATVGSAFSYTIKATDSPIRYNASGLPSGLTVNTTTGTITGTPTTAAGSPFSVTLSATNSSGTGTANLTLTISALSKISFVQATAGTTPGSASSFSVSFAANTIPGDVILVGFDFTGATFSSISDSQGNTFTEVGRQLTSPGGAFSRVHYAKNIKGGADTVTVHLSARSPWIEVYLTEYSGLDQTNPIDGQAGASGSAGAVSSGNATTTVAGDIIYGYCVGDSTCTVGSGFTARSTLNNNLIEDMTAGNPGTYAATGTANNGWSMQMVALKPRAR